MRRTWYTPAAIVSMLALPVDAAVDLSPSFLGMYHKTMVIERDLDKRARRYGVDPHTVCAVLCRSPRTACRRAVGPRGRPGAVADKARRQTSSGGHL